MINSCNTSASLLARDPRLRFTKQLNEAYVRSGRSCIASAALAGIAPSYLSDLLAGHRHRVSLYKLRCLCEQAWDLPLDRALRIFRLRLACDESVSDVLPTEFFWRLAMYPTLPEFAKRVGVTRAYLTLILQGRRCPSIAVLQHICVALGLDAAHSLQLYGQLSQPNMRLGKSSR